MPRVSADDCGRRSAGPHASCSRPGPPTAELLHPIGPEVPDDRHVQQVIDLCIRIGEVLLSSGEGSGETTETMLRVANAFGLSAVDVDITFTAVTICCHRGMAATPITSMRLVTHRGLDLTLLARVYRLVEQIERGRGLRPSAAALDAAVTATHPYRAGWRRPAPRGWRERSHCCWAHRPSRCSRPPVSPRSST
jgi:hypothetical protein